MTRCVVITGTDGFIGRHLARRFSDEGYSVFALIRENSSGSACLADIPRVQVVSLDLRQWSSFFERLPQEPEAFIHLAWGGVSPEHRDDFSTQASNIPLSLDAVRLAAALHAKRFILPGSTMEYAYSGQIISAKASPSPQNAYGAAKIAARYLCAALAAELHISFIYAVISGIYAPDRRDNNVIWYTIRSLLEGDVPKLTKLEQKWDYIHIDDVTQAFLLIAQKGKAGAFYTIGHGDNCPLYDYITAIRDIINPVLPLGIGEIPYKDERLPSSCVDLQPLHEDTGFIPAIPFEEGIREVIRQVQKEAGK